MSQRHRKAKNKTKESMFLYGKNSVLSRIVSNPSTIRQVFIQDNFDELDILRKIESAKIPLKIVSPKRLLSIKRKDDLQGIVAEVEPFQYVALEDLIHQTDDKKLTLIFLDRVCDPQNVGSIIRTVACFGGFAVVIPAHNSCKVTDAVVHVASGGENHVPVALVSNLSNAIIAAKKCGYWIAGSVVGEGKNLTKADFLFPLGLVVGSEGEGVRYGIQKNLDLTVQIPMKGASLSFNVATACALFCYEIVRQKNRGPK